MNTFDAHAHMVAQEFQADRGEVLKRAEEFGALGILSVVETLEEAGENLILSRQFPVLKPAAGLYPTILDREQAAAMVAFIRKHQERLVAIGEVGLDYWKVQDPADRQTQREIFSQFISLSLELDLPLNVHSRSAGLEAIHFLKEQGARRVLMHAFDGKASSALEGVAAGFFFSIPPSVVRSPQKQKLVRRLPLECFLLETDSPVLGPDPKARNEPGNILLACKTVAEIKGIPQEEVARITTENARRLFPRAFP